MSRHTDVRSLNFHRRRNVNKIQSTERNKFARHVSPFLSEECPEVGRAGGEDKLVSLFNKFSNSKSRTGILKKVFMLNFDR